MPEVMNVNNSKARRVSDYIFSEEIGTNWVANIVNENFPKAKNVGAKYEVSTKIYKCLYLKNYKGAWEELYRTN